MHSPERCKRSKPIWYLSLTQRTTKSDTAKGVAWHKLADRRCRWTACVGYLLLCPGGRRPRPMQAGSICATRNDMTFTACPSKGEINFEYRQSHAPSWFPGTLSDVCHNIRTARNSICKATRACKISKHAMADSEAEPELGLAWTVCAKAGGRRAGQNGAGQISICGTVCYRTKLTLQGCTAGMHVVESSVNKPQNGWRILLRLHCMGHGTAGTTMWTCHVL